jgi:hypothetical protein
VSTSSGFELEGVKIATAGFSYILFAAVVTVTGVLIAGINYQRD